MSNRPRTTRRPATEQDVPFLLRLRHQTMDPHLTASGITISDEEHLARVRYRLECAEVVLVDDEAVGLIKVARDVGHDRPTWEIIQLQIAPAMQGRGLGAELLSDLIDQATLAEVDLMLDVLKVNPARHLYERLGFVVVAESELAFDMLRRAAT